MKQKNYLIIKKQSEIKNLTRKARNFILKIVIKARVI